MTVRHKNNIAPRESNQRFGGDAPNAANVRLRDNNVVFVVVLGLVDGLVLEYPECAIPDHPRYFVTV